jgi:hypothetical protein
MRIKLIIVLLTVTLGLTQVILAQSPWTKPKNKGYVQLGVSGIFYDQVQYDGKTVLTGFNQSDITTQIYSEYGITNKLEAQVILPYKTYSYKTKSGNISESISGLGNISFGLKYLLSDKKWKISSGLQFSANTISRNKSKGLRTGFDAATFLPYITVGSSSQKWYYYGNIGYGLMTNNYSDYIKIGAEVGYNFAPKAHVMLVIETRSTVTKESFFTTDKIDFATTANYLDRQNYIAPGIKVNYEFKKDKFGVNAAVFGAAGINNAPLAPSINFALYTKF